MIQFFKSFIVVLTLFTGQICQDVVNPISIFITPEQKPAPLLIELLQADSLYDPADNFHEIVQKTQKHWIAVRQGQNQKERRDLVDSEKQAAMRQQVSAIATRMGLFQAIKPSYQHYQYGVCLGAFLDGVRFRLSELVKAWECGIRFDNIVFLTGERMLRKGAGEPDDYQVLCNPAKSPLPFRKDWKAPNLQEIKYETETDMMRLVWEQVALPPDMEEALRGKVFFVDAPKGNAARPSTEDTYRVWREQYHPAPGRVFAPNYPLIWSYQQLTGMRVMGPEFIFDTHVKEVSRADLDLYGVGLISLIFDTVAKCLYEVEKMSNCH